MTKSREVNMNNTQYLLDQFGPLIGGKDLMKALGYRTQAAFYKAIRESRIKVTIFEIDGRQGKFAMTNEVGQWLDSLSPSKQTGGEN